MRVAVVIVHHGSWLLTDDCVKSVEKAVNSAFEKDIIVIDNSDCDNYAVGANKGIIKALDGGADYVCLLNNDTHVDQLFLEKMLKTTYDICGSKIYDWGNCFTNQLQPYECSMNTWLGLPRYIPDVFKKECDLKQYDGIKSVQCVNGCCMLVKKEVFEKVGLFDTRYVSYFEDMDFCVRAARAGFAIGLSPYAYVWHKGGQSSSSVYKTKMITSSRIKFMRKHASKLQFAVFNLFYFGFYLWASLLFYFFYGEDFSHEKAVFEGIKNGYK